MASYHLYFLRRGMLIGSGEIEAADDAAAAELARSQSDGDSVEIWSDDRRLGIVETAAEPATP